MINSLHGKNVILHKTCVFNISIFKIQHVLYTNAVYRKMCNRADIIDFLQ